MPVPTLISELALVAANNSPPGSESPSLLDDYTRAHASFIAGLRDGVGFTNPVVLASAATTEIGAQNAMFVDISGVTTVTSFGTTYRGPRFLRFTGAMLLTHNATALNLIGGANITTVAGDTALAIPNQALTGWNVVQYTRGSALAALSGANTDITSLAGLTTALSIPQGGTGSAVGSRGFSKADANTVAFTKLTAGTAQIKAGTRVEVASVNINFASATTITMPTLTAGTDYAIYACTDGTVRADANFSAPTGYTTANSRKIGGFHYAPGGNAAAQAGGDSTPAINQFSFYDLKFKPACLDPRGMALVADGFFADIYLLGVDYLTNGTSKFNVTIADGSSPPKVPTQFGGNGTTTYTTLNWWEANEVLRSVGKRPPSYDEFAALAFGTTEASSGGTDPGTTILRAAYTSKWGVMLATGNMFIWGAVFGGGAAAAAYTANTGGRGSSYQMENAAVFGGGWAESSNSGSRCSVWIYSPSISFNSFGSRGVSDLLILE